MSLRLTKPGASVALRHPKTGELLRPIYVTKSGKVVWPQMGASSDDPDDPGYTGDGGSGRRDLEEDDSDASEDDEDESTEDEDGKSKDKEEDKKPPTRPEREAARYRVQRNALQKELNELKAEIRAQADKDKPADEVAQRDLKEAQGRVADLEEVNRIMSAQLAFFKSNTIDWADSSDAFALAEREGLFDEVIDEDGNVDTRELQRSLRDLAKRKPHLVKKSRASGSDDDDDEDGQRSSGSTMNGRRKGSKDQGPTQAALAKRFPVLGR